MAFEAGSNFVLNASREPARYPCDTRPFSRLRSTARSRYRSQLERARLALLESNSVARTCTICAHAKLVNIDRQLLRGDMLNGIAHRFHVSPDAVGRHRRHMRTAMLKAQAAAETQDLVYGQTLIDEVKAIKADAERLQLEAEGRRDIRAALQAIRERVGIVELQAKLMGNSRIDLVGHLPVALVLLEPDIEGACANPNQLPVPRKGSFP